MSAFLVLGVSVLSEEGDLLHYAKLQEVKEGDDIKAVFSHEKYGNEKIDCAFLYFDEDEAQKHVDELNDHLMRCGISAL